MPNITKEQVFEAAKQKGLKPSEVMQKLSQKGYVLVETPEPKTEATVPYKGDTSMDNPAYRRWLKQGEKIGALENFMNTFSNRLAEGGTDLVTGLMRTGAGVQDFVGMDEQAGKARSLADTIEKRADSSALPERDGASQMAGNVVGIPTRNVPALVAGTKAGNMVQNAPVVAKVGGILGNAVSKIPGASAVSGFVPNVIKNAFTAQNLAGGAAGVQGYNQVREGEPASAGETAVGAAANVVLPVAAAGASAGLKKAAAGGAKSAEEKAAKLATEILQPGKAKLAEDLARNKQAPEVVALVDNVKKAKNFTELKNTLQQKTKEIFKQRDEIFDANNFSIGDDYLKSLDDAIAKAKSQNLQSPARIKVMEEVAKRERDYLESVGGTITRKAAQARKESLQELTQPLLKKKEVGNLAADEASEMAALDALRSGLMKSIEGSDDVVRNINGQYEGLKEAVKLLAGREALTQKEISRTLLQRIAAPIVDLISGSTGAGSAAFVARLAAKQNRNLKSLTKELIKLRNRSKDKAFIQKVIDLLNSVQTSPISTGKSTAIPVSGAALINQSRESTTPTKPKDYQASKNGKVLSANRNK